MLGIVSVPTESAGLSKPADFWMLRQKLGWDPATRHQPKAVFAFTLIPLPAHGQKCIVHGIHLHRQKLKMPRTWLNKYNSGHWASTLEKVASAKSIACAKS